MTRAVTLGADDKATRAVYLRGRNLLRESLTYLQAEAKRQEEPTLAAGSNVLAVALQVTVQQAINHSMADGVQILEAIAQLHAWALSRASTPDKVDELLAAHTASVRDVALAHNERIG